MRLILALLATVLLALAALSAKGAPAHEANHNLRSSWATRGPIAPTTDTPDHSRPSGSDRIDAVDG